MSRLNPRFMTVFLMMHGGMALAGGDQNVIFFPQDNTTNLIQSIDSAATGNPFKTPSMLGLDDASTGLFGSDAEREGDRPVYIRRNDQSTFGEELVVGMKFSSLLSVHLNLFDQDNNRFTAPMGSNTVDLSWGANGLMRSNTPGFQLGISSVMSLGESSHIGIELGRGKISGETLGLYSDQVTATSIGMGYRSDKFGATINSDLISGQANGLWSDQSMVDFKVDWHFTKDGTISFGARKNFSDNTDAQNTTIDDLTGTVPYIRFRHNL